MLWLLPVGPWGSIMPGDIPGEWLRTVIVLAFIVEGMTLGVTLAICSLTFKSYGASALNGRKGPVWAEASGPCCGTSQMGAGGQLLRRFGTELEHPSSSASGAGVTVGAASH